MNLGVFPVAQIRGWHSAARGPGPSPLLLWVSQLHRDAVLLQNRPEGGI